MPMCQPGREVPEQDLVTNHLVAEEAWGEIWRAEHDELGKVLFVAYTSAAGTAMFRDALPTLERWQDTGDMMSGHILPILKISADTAIPYILARDPGGPTLRELVNHPETTIEADQLVRGAVEWVGGVVTAVKLNMAPVGITPDTLFKVTTGQAHWCVLPVAPRTVRQGLLAGGRYFAPELEHAADLSISNGDCYALGWILAEVLSEDWELVRLPAVLQKAIPIEKLRDAVNTGLASNHGIFVDPNVYDLSLRRWLRNDAEKESKQLHKLRKKAAKAQGKKPVPSKKAKTPAPSGGANAALPPAVPSPDRGFPGTAEHPAGVAPPVVVTSKKKKSGGSDVGMLIVKIVVSIVVFTAAGVGAYFLAKGL